MSDPVRVDIPAGGNARAAFVAFRTYAAAVAASKGKVLGPAWFRDDPENMPPQPQDSATATRHASITEMDACSVAQTLPTGTTSRSAWQGPAGRATLPRGGFSLGVQRTGSFRDRSNPPR
jgi:hypothetical protein